jgi:serine acetyltransferase
VLDGAKIFGPHEVGEPTGFGAAAMVASEVPARRLVMPPKEATAMRMRPRTDLETVPPEASAVPTDAAVAS